MLENNPPANNNSFTSKILEEHLHTLHAARQEFVKAEACEKIKRALSRKTRSYSDQVYCSGDKVYFKRLSSDVWHGPAKVLGKDGQMCLLKHGGFYLRVHPCRMTPVYCRTVPSPSDTVSNCHTTPDTSCSIKTGDSSKAPAIDDSDSGDE